MSQNPQYRLRDELECWWPHREALRFLPCVGRNVPTTTYWLAGCWDGTMSHGRLCIAFASYESVKSTELVMPLGKLTWTSSVNKRKSWQTYPQSSVGEAPHVTIATKGDEGDIFYSTI